ncbi:hypothetical protein NC651_005945 [Populus alba x Populus x berolinensis]|nr:hypothetical protein NC651_005945 [Populus alba x Populus x berolinensis]
MVLREETSTPVRSPTTESKVIMWTCTVSAPEMTIVLYSINGLPLYQGREGGFELATFSLEERAAPNHHMYLQITYQAWELQCIWNLVN